ncbi:SRPBCC family protein, partial [Pseudomonas aeruginosa]|uniref:SRPBCC family protein n=1 Tax=Pseudomonas aeruginosa TaxID=287 RepID=UPI0024B737B9
ATLAYAASPGLWPEWHPSSLRVDGAAGPLPAGARFEEDIHAGGRARLAFVAQAQVQTPVATGVGAPQVSRLVLDHRPGQVPGAAGTRFVRTLEYRFDGWSMRLANLFLLRRRIERESEESMHRLRRVAEARI